MFTSYTRVVDLVRMMSGGTICVLMSNFYAFTFVFAKFASKSPAFHYES